MANIRVPKGYESAVRAKEAARENIKVAESEEPRLITKVILSSVISDNFSLRLLSHPLSVITYYQGRCLISYQLFIIVHYSLSIYRYFSLTFIYQEGKNEDSDGVTYCQTFLQR